MKYINIRLILILIVAIIFSCDKINPDTGDPTISDPVPGGILDMAFMYRVQGDVGLRVKKVELSLAKTADDLYRGIFFTQANVSDAVVHYQFELPPGEYYYYATVTCLCGGDTCKYAGFPGQNGLIAAGGKVTVEDAKTTHFTTQFH